MWDLSFLTRDRTCVPCIARWILNHWTTRKVPRFIFIGLVLSIGSHTESMFDSGSTDKHTNKLGQIKHGQIRSHRVGYGEGDGTPLQYSCLETPMDGGAWWAAVHGVADGQT